MRTRSEKEVINEATIDWSQKYQYDLLAFNIYAYKLELT